MLIFYFFLFITGHPDSQLLPLTLSVSAFKSLESLNNRWNTFLETLTIPFYLIYKILHFSSVFIMRHSHKTRLFIICLLKLYFISQIKNPFCLCKNDLYLQFPRKLKVFSVTVLKGSEQLHFLENISGK